MRKLLISIIALFSTLSVANAQEEVYTQDGRQDPSTIWVNKVEDGEEWRDENRWHDPFDIYAGPVAGMMASNMTKLDGNYLFSPYFGGILHVYFSNHFGMSFEIGYSHQGVRNARDNFHSYDDLKNYLFPSDDFPSNEWTYDNVGKTLQNIETGYVINVDQKVEEQRGPWNYNFHYINSAYKLRYYPIRQFNVYAGFLFGVHFSASSTLNGKKADIKGHLRKRAGHIIGGAGYEFDNLYFEGYYGLPISKLASSKKAKFILGDAHEQVILLTVGYKFKVY